ncbi:MAG: YfbM family protein [Planctomycetota bacterium]|nr:YfbM family protein [Planctomycetota bacterium]
MGTRGVFFALDAADTARLLAASSDDDVRFLIQEEIEERWDTDWLDETDSAWDAMHRCLGDGTLGPGSPPLGQCVLGGRHLHEGRDYIVSYLSPAEVQEVAAALEGIDEAWMRAQFARLASTDYEGEMDEADFEYTWSYFGGARELYRKAAQAGRSMVFTVSQ